MMVDDVLVVVGDTISCDGGMVVSTDTVASIADSGGRGGDAGDSGGDGTRRMCGSLLRAKILIKTNALNGLRSEQVRRHSLRFQKISRFPQTDSQSHLFVFEELLQRAREKEEKEAKKRKRLADEFYEFLHASKEITASSKWEDNKSLFGDRQVASFAFIDLELLTRLQGPLESDN
ncbi:hypothetical protein CQW23_13439 [Capsicum baccatum]|uniref:FF domain-containing protein n=1 Tax=Capsicum baccatum TaxID=33114 RepID=A0A2G2WVK9_CAPBA|nr:hypothetical protein CQW23_13439 [Capsicum baccatum]